MKRVKTRFSHQRAPVLKTGAPVVLRYTLDMGGSPALAFRLQEILQSPAARAPKGGPVVFELIFNPSKSQGGLPLLRHRVE